MLSRRRFGQFALAAMPLTNAFGKINSVVQGIQFGLQSYSFNGTPIPTVIDVVIQSMVETGLGEVDVWSPLIEPAEFSEKARAAGATAEDRAQARAAIAKWRATESLGYFRAIRKRFEDKGIEVTAFSTSTGSADEELNRTMEITKALGAKVATVGVSMPVAKRLVPIADKHGVWIGIQGSPRMNSTNPDQICRPEQYEAALALSPTFYASFDVGDAVGGGYTASDVLKFVRDNHKKIFQLYLKDRNKANLSLPWGEGDTPIKEILLLMRDLKTPARGYLDNDYKSPTSRAEDVKRSFEFAKKVLAG
jgi:sugar phosphate isomerase/epimerase